MIDRHASPFGALHPNVCMDVGVCNSQGDSICCRGRVCSLTQRFDPRDFRRPILSAVNFTVMAVAWKERVLHVFPNVSHFQSTQVNQ